MGEQGVHPAPQDCWEGRVDVARYGGWTNRLHRHRLTTTLCPTLRIVNATAATWSGPTDSPRPWADASPPRPGSHSVVR